MILHPGGDLHMPLSSHLPSTIHTLHQWQRISVTWRNGLRPPIWQTDVDLLLADFSFQECLLGVLLKQIEAMLDSNRHE
jgi:hypothetical protein